MVKPEWGIKRLCQSCGARYYDFLKSPIVCPSCQAPFDPEAVLKSRRSRQIPAEAPRKPKPEAEAEEAEEEDDEDEDELEDELDDDEVVAVVPDDEDELGGMTQNWKPLFMSNY